MKAIALAAIIVSSSAYADDSLGVLVGPGVGRVDDDTIFTMRLDFGRQTSPMTMIGAHFAASTSSTRGDVRGSPPLLSGTTYRYRPVDIGATIMYGGPVLIGAWLGVQAGSQSVECDYTFEGKSCTGGGAGEISVAPALGILFAVDVLSTGGHHLTLTADFSVALKTESRDSEYGAGTVGLAYRVVWTP